jgi:hypothetical protein
LFERRANSFIIASKTNIIEQVKKTNNKNQNKKLDVKGKDIVMKFNSKWFIYNKTGHQVNNYKNKAQERNFKKKKRLLKTMSPGLITL